MHIAACLGLGVLFPVDLQTNLKSKADASLCSTLLRPRNLTSGVFMLMFCGVYC